MSFIHTVPDSEADGDVASLYRQDEDRQGYVANYTRAFSHRPEVMHAWRNLNIAIRSNMDLRMYELATLAAAMQLRSSYCSLAHAKILKDTVLNDGELERIAADYRDADLSEADVAVMAFAEQVALDATAITHEDVARLRSAGLTDSQIFDVAATAAGRSFFSKTLDALGTEPDPVYHDEYPPGLKQRLTVGREIEAR